MGQWFGGRPTWAEVDLDAVTTLAEGRWLRRTSGRGQFHFQNETLSVTVRHARKVVVATFDLQGQQFVFTSAHSDEVLLRFCPAWLSAEAITGTQGV